MALWSGRFSEAGRAELIAFSESISYDRRLYAQDIAGSKAHAAMLGASGIIPEASARAIIAGLDDIRRRIDAGEFEFKAELEDIHMHIESELTRAIGPEGARLHSGRSRNDQIALDIRLYLRGEIDRLIEMIRELQRALVAKAAENPRVIMPGFTHLQHAQVVLFAHHLLAYAEMFDRDAERLADCRRRINVMPLGAGALAGSTLPLNREMVAELLDFPKVTRNSMDSVADRDFAMEFAAAAAIFAVHASRLSEDIILWSSQEFNFVELADSFCTGSSLMPQKKNPDVAELTRGRSGRCVGNLVALLTLCKGLPLTYNRDLQLDKEPLFDSIDTIAAILGIWPGMIATMTIHPERMAAAAGDPALMATDLAEKLVGMGVPFREAHRQVGALVKYSREHDKPLDELTVEEMRECIPLADAGFAALFDPEASVAAREITGGTGFKAVAGEIENWRKRLKM